MAIKTVQGRKFILVARPGISSNTSMFPQKVVQLSGHGINSGKEFSVNVKVNAGLQKANINNNLFTVNGTLVPPTPDLPPPPPPPQDTPPPQDPPVYQNPNQTTQQQQQGGGYQKPNRAYGTEPEL